MPGDADFGGRIGNDWRDSEPWWPPVPEPPAITELPGRGVAVEGHGTTTSDEITPQYGGGMSLGIDVVTLTHDGRSSFIVTAVQGGQAQAGEILISGYSNEDPVFGIDSVPFLATSYADAAKLWKASKKAIDDRFAKQGLVVLYTVPWPPQGIYSSKPLASVADMKGLKMRTYNPYTSRIAELAGAQPVTIQVAELAQAFATGAVNANITSGATGYDTKAWEVVKNYYDTQAWLPKNVTLINKAAFDRLDKPTQDALLKVAAAAETRGWWMSQDKHKWYGEQLAAHGLKVLSPSEDLKTGLQQIGERLTGEWVVKAGADGRAVIDAYKKPNT